MKLLLDMNLSPSWVERLAGHGFEAVHWSTIGAATAPDVEILKWANEHAFVLITDDLDFSAILAAGADQTPEGGRTGARGTTRQVDAPGLVRGLLPRVRARAE